MKEDPQAAALEIRLLATVLAKAARRDLERRLADQANCVGALPYAVLWLLSGRERTLSELSRLLLVTPATLVPVVDALARNGLALRRQDPFDRRRAPLALTERGRELLGRVPLLEGSDSLVRAAAALGPARLAQLLRLLRELVGNLTAGESVLADVASAVRCLDVGRGDQTLASDEDRYESAAV
ncbi:MAG: MarR family transcriptional regulator [Chloroflexi bacterium]|nr:MarR family transcriptional regulator [Chloroflexota bacterium]